MKLWRFECYKLWRNKLICCLMLGCLLMNGLLLLWQTKYYDVENRCFPITIRGVYEELESVQEQEKIDWLNQELASAEAVLYEMGDMQDTDIILERRNALNHVLENVQACIPMKHI